MLFVCLFALVLLMAFGASKLHNGHSSESSSNLVVVVVVVVVMMVERERGPWFGDLDSQ